jgi:hypothetical protein
MVNESAPTYCGRGRTGRVQHRVSPAPASSQNHVVPADEDGSHRSGPRQWLVLVYKVPSEPTRLRATVWRRLKGMGAVYLQNSVAALPASAAAERSLRKLRHEIVGMEGTAVLLSAGALVGEPELTAKFNAARNDEYEEIVDRCEDFRAQLAKEYAAEHFTFAELEENEVDLSKLRNWLASVVARDVLGGTGRHQAESALEECAAALQDYANRVFAEENEGT